MERTQALARNHLLAVESLAVFVGLPNFTHVVIIFFMHVQEINFFFLQIVCLILWDLKLMLDFFSLIIIITVYHMIDSFNILKLYSVG